MHRTLPTLGRAFTFVPFPHSPRPPHSPAACSVAVSVAVLVSGSQALWRNMVKRLTIWEHHDTWTSHRYVGLGGWVAG
jgi:hypothetical protein